MERNRGGTFMIPAEIHCPFFFSNNSIQVYGDFLAFGILLCELSDVRR